VRGFEGTFEPMKTGHGYVSVGRVLRQTETSLLIDELPVQCWTENYKENTLLKLREQGIINGIIENHSTSKVSFTVTVKSSLEMDKLMKQSLEKVFKLRKSFSTVNMHAFDADYVLKKFNTPEEVIEAYFPVRMALYEDRRSVLESEMSYNAALHQNKARFIQLVIAGEIDLMSGRKTKQETAARLKELNFSSSATLNEIRNDNALSRRRQQAPSVALDDNITDEIYDSEFDYLLSMPLSSLTMEKVGSLQEEAAKLVQQLQLAQKTTASDLWRRDLDKLEPYL
jgi:DNA topoisomerase-2